MTRVNVPEQVASEQVDAPTAERPDNRSSARLAVARPKLPRRWAVVAAAVVAAAGVGAVVGWAPWQTAPPRADSASTATTQSRDEAAESATDALLAFNTIDHDNMAETIRRWLEVSGGELHQQVRQNRAGLRDRAARTAADTTASIVETAISSYDYGAGRATVLGVLEVRTQPARGEPEVRLARFRVLVQHLASGWKATFLEALEVPS